MFSSFTPEVINMIGKGVLETLYMTLVSTICGYIIGLPWGVALSVTDKSGLRPNRAVYQVLSFIANVMRSIPFLILLILVMPFTLFLIGRTYGSTATIVPLTLSASPLIARMVETSLQDVDRGVIEAAESMGADTLTIILRVMLVEARVSLISGIVIMLGTVLGYSAMAGVVGGGGLGDIAIRYGYYRYQADIMIVTVILLVALVMILQLLGSKIALALDKRK
jgi:D-methionine transport system permease protein